MRPTIGGLMNRYLLSRTFGPMAAVLTSTMLAFLLERVLRSFDLLAQTQDGFSYLVGLMMNLAPHYLGLILPVGFFIALFVVVNRLNNESEIDAMLASGMSLGRIAAPFVALGVVLMLLSLLLYGFIQPYSRYGYRAVLHAAENAGWSGQIQPRALLSPDPSLLLTAEGVDPTGQRLQKVFLRRLSPGGREDVLTAATADIHHNQDGLSVTLDLRDGQQLSTNPTGAPHLLTFSELTVRLPLAPAARLLRSRGSGEETELTLTELARMGYGGPTPALPRETLLAELYSRLARALVLPLMPLLAVPFGLSAKRAQSRAAFAIAGLLLFAFQTSLLLGQSLADKGAASAATVIGWPFAIFSTICLLTFISSRKTPGENPVNRLAEFVSDRLRAVAPRA
jgi:lipopolysaccharide export system permease protein